MADEERSCRIAAEEALDRATEEARTMQLAQQNQQALVHILHVSGGRNSAGIWQSEFAAETSTRVRTLRNCESSFVLKTVVNTVFSLKKARYTPHHVSTA